MGTPFSESLIKLRKEAGFTTAYKFFHGNGGAAGLRFSYRLYLMMEQGRSLPPFENLPVLIKALKLVVGTKACDELVKHWLKTLTGEQLYSALISPLIRKSAPVQAGSALQDMAGKLLSQKKQLLSPKQFDVIAKTPAHHLCYLALGNDAGKWTPETLSRALSLRPGEALEALRDLTAARILARDRRGAYFCPLHVRMTEHPWDGLDPESAKRIAQYQQKLIASGKSTYHIKGFIRADMLLFPDFYQLMKTTLQGAEAYSTTNRSSDSALLAIEGRVTKLRDF